MSGETPFEEIAPRALKDRLDRGEGPVLLDVRERWESEFARIEGSIEIPLSDLMQRYGELDPGAETVAYCHVGLRSAHATLFLLDAGFSRVLNLEGGIDAYSLVDPSIPRY